MLVLVVIFTLSMIVKEGQGIQNPFKRFGIKGNSQHRYQKVKALNMSRLKMLIQSQGGNSIHPKDYFGCLAAFNALYGNSNRKKSDIGTFKSECSDLFFYPYRCFWVIEDIEEDDDFSSFDTNCYVSSVYSSESCKASYIAASTNFDGSYPDTFAYSCEYESSFGYCARYLDGFYPLTKDGFQKYCNPDTKWNTYEESECKTAYNAVISADEASIDVKFGAFDFYCQGASNAAACEEKRKEFRRSHEDDDISDFQKVLKESCNPDFAFLGASINSVFSANCLVLSSIWLFQ
jgi:hypothetical protein